ncbi:MAG: hypothetical protein OXE57_06695 [Alphaproteobacteria bacterium]|nr:hypothetical protein [Alphaproteobacteria bacterium]
MHVMVHRFWIEKGSWQEFRRLSREGVWPPMAQLGARILGFYLAEEPEPNPEVPGACDMVWLLIAYADKAHRAATRTNSPTFAGSRALHDRLEAARRERMKLILATSDSWCAHDGSGFMPPQWPVAEA